MKRKLTCLILIFLCCLPAGLFAQQQKKPKVALVLSGGGAKGIAHIPLLEALDSLGIVPDLVIGTSMGSIVGGLYSIGYSGDSIAAIAHNANWTELLGGDINLEDVGIDEKSEFKRHLVDFDLIKGKPKVNSGLLKDQKLREFITSLAYPTFRIHDFDSLSIPYRAVATDIVNGQEVVFEKGSVSLAMRSSMSIPGVFQPVHFENTLLVDGGVLNNFPVDIAKKMGYDIIIGSDVGGGMQKKEKLDNIASLLFQAGMLTSNLKNPTNRALCDILVDHVENLTYSTGDFNSSDAIYDQGKIGVQNSMSQLMLLAEQLKVYEQREHKLPEVKDEFVLDTIIYNNFSAANLELVEARMDIETGTKYKTAEIIGGIDRAMGTTLFNQITYNGFIEDDITGLQLNAFEHSRHRIKGSLHYDSYREVGVMVNYTGRNILGKASRLLFTLDIAVQPRFRLQYQKSFGEEKDWWWRSEVMGEFLEQIFYLNGQVADDMRSDYFLINNQFNKSLNTLHSYVGFDASYENTHVHPKIDPSIKDNLLNLEDYWFRNLEIGGHYFYNRMNKVFYPTKGTFLRGFLGRSLLHDLEVDYSLNEIENIDGETNGFTRIGLDLEKRMPFSEKVSGILGLNLGFILEDDLGSGEFSFGRYGYAGKYAVGGVVSAPRKNSYVLPGLHEDELLASQLMNLNLCLQWSPASKFYVTPHVNLASVGFGDFSDYMREAFSPNGDWSDGLETSAILTAGTMLSYDSFLGPINFDVSYANDINQVRFFFGIGLSFNRSN